MERNLGATLVENEPPCITEDGGTANVSSDDEVPEEEPPINQRLSAISWRDFHDRMVRWVEAKCSCWEAVGDEINPE